MSDPEFSPSLPPGWALASYEECIDTVSDHGLRVEQSEYLEAGTLPVIDQGEGLIGGYTNDLEKRYLGPLPVLVFGDHTRRIKFIDFPFAVGAQGVKLLCPRSCWIPKLLAYLIPTLPLPNRGYSRHFQFLRQLQFPVPPLQEQRLILAELEKQLSRLEFAIDALRRSRSQIQAYAVSVLQSACSGRLVPTDSETGFVDLGDSETIGNPGQRHQGLPEGWSWQTLNQIGSVTGGLTKNPGRENLINQLPYLRVANVYAGRLDLGEIKTIGVRPEEAERFLLKKNDLLIVEGNGSLEQVGRVALWDGEISPCVHQNHIIKIRPRDSRYSKYLLFWLLSPQGRSHIRAVASSTTGLHTLSVSKIEALPVMLPPLSEQSRIISEIERRLSLVSSLEKTVEDNLRRADALRSSILKQAFGGRLTAQDSNNEPASILLEHIRKSREAGIDSQPRKGRGIKPEILTPAPEAQPVPESQREGGSIWDSPPAPSGLGIDFEVSFLGLLPQAISPSPFGAEETDEDSSTLLELPVDQQARVLWEHLVGMGPLRQDDAIRTVAGFLRCEGLVNREYLRPEDPLWRAMAAAIDLGVKRGLFDRPRRGEVRALLSDARDYSLELWSLCLLVSMEFGRIDEDQALRAAAEEARKRMGLKFERLRSGGVILQGLRDALKDEVRQGHLRREGGKIWLTPVEDLEN